MKKVAGSLKIDQSQFRELEAFAKFGSDLDATTLSILDKGKKNVQILKQGQYRPCKVEDQVAILFCGANALLKSVPIVKVSEFETEYISYLHLKHQDVMDKLKKGAFDDEITKTLKSVALEIAEKYSKA